jgi:uncharacterized protein YdeI (YjbR/CyaY-like superfamily)
MLNGVQPLEKNEREYQEYIAKVKAPKNDGAPVNESIVKDEYLKCQDLIEKFDARAFLVKSWSVSLASGGIGRKRKGVRSMFNPW